AFLLRKQTICCPCGQKIAPEAIYSLTFAPFYRKMPPFAKSFRKSISVAKSYPFAKAPFNTTKHRCRNA
ncbi:MAG: hypothetical protein JXA78_15005, partial [Anaerolineales bacterium]|nr:hypothetical protein [Anaerolineales bacterium]